MKKLVLFLAAVSIFALVSCSAKDQIKEPAPDTTENEVVTTHEATDADTTSEAEETTALEEEETTKAEEETKKAEDTTKAAQTTASPEAQKPKDTTGASASITIKDPTKIPTASAPTTQAPSKPETPKTGYESISCIEPAGTKVVYLAKGEHNEAVSLYVPDDWTLSGNKTDGYTVYRKGAKIGSATFATSFSHSYCEKCEQSTRMGARLDNCILKNASSYQRRLVFTNKAGDKIILTVDYQYLSANSISKIKNTMRSNLLYTDPGLGTVPVSNGKKSILILGNSFVNTSEIGDFLGSMIAGGNKTYKVNAVSRGYYTLSSYVQDPDTMAAIRNGNYGVVFICGIYGFNEVYDLKYMVEACKESNTTLVVFPAHNESAEFIADAKKQYYNVHFLDWKSEIDMLINTGIPWSAFCIDDQHKHSTPLAGYVGAHMIYRSIFSEMPPSIGTSVPGYSQTYIDSYLGDYVTMGGVPNFPSSEVYMF